MTKETSTETKAKYKFYISVTVIVLSVILLALLLFVPWEGKTEYVLTIVGGAIGWCSHIVKDYMEDD